jgi:multidrug efflux pump subunit AcrA (membrane-fusion protein)
LKILIVLFLTFNILFAKVYYAKVEPYELRNISSNVSGLVTYANEDLIGRKLDNKPYIRIDSELDKKELKYINDKLQYIGKMIDANENILQNLNTSLEKKRKNYKKFIGLKFKSSLAKDKEYYNLIQSENLNLNTQKEIQNLKIKATDLKLRKAKLQRSLRDKNLVANGFILYEILVKAGQVVGISTPLAKIADISRARLSIYLDARDVENAKNKIIFIDSLRTNYKITSILNIADSRNISKYMAQIIIPSPKLFSKLVKIELIDENINE